MKHITLDEIRSMRGSEGLILQGCGGDLNEWVSGINDLFTKEDILLEGDIFTDVATFENDSHTNLLLNMDDVKLDIVKLAMWRLQTHSTFGGCWLSDYQDNHLGADMEASEEQQKPASPIIGADGNIFNIMGIASRTLKENGMTDAAKEMRSRIMDSSSYGNALAIITEYVEPVGIDEFSQGGMEMLM